MGTKTTAAPIGDPIAAYKAMIEKLEAEGDHAPESTIANEHPKLQEAYLIAVNTPQSPPPAPPAVDPAIAAYQKRITELASAGNPSPEKTIAVEQPKLQEAYLAAVNTGGK